MEKVEKVLEAVKALEAKHREALDAIAKENGFADYDALVAGFEEKVATKAKRAVKKAKATSSVPKKQRKARAKLTPQIKLEIAKAYMERGEKTAAEIAAKFGVSQFTVYKVATTKMKKPAGFVVGSV